MITCEECKQECCNNIVVEMEEPVTAEDWDDIKWQVAHRNVRVILDNDDDWCVEFETVCDEMDETNKCKVYDKRPRMCRTHDAETCFVNGEGEYYRVILASIADVEQYLATHPEAIKDEEVEVHECPKCGHEWSDEDDNEDDEYDEYESEIEEGVQGEEIEESEENDNNLSVSSENSIEPKAPSQVQ